MRCTGCASSLFGEQQVTRDDQVALAAQTEMQQVQQLIDQGNWDAAQDKLQTVTSTVQTVEDPQRQQELQQQLNDLTVKVETRDPNATAPPLPGAPIVPNDRYRMPRPLHCRRCRQLPPSVPRLPLPDISLPQMPPIPQLPLPGPGVPPDISLPDLPQLPLPLPKPVPQPKPVEQPKPSSRRARAEACAEAGACRSRSPRRSAEARAEADRAAQADRVAEAD